MLNVVVCYFLPCGNYSDNILIWERTQIIYEKDSSGEIGMCALVDIFLHMLIKTALNIKKKNLWEVIH